MRKILIVEDDGNIALSLEIRLKAAGFQVRTAVDAISAVDAAEEYRPDLILVDIAIPAGGGFSVVEKAQTMPELKAVPIIFVTASQAPGVQERSDELGGYAFFNKPYDFGELLAAIRGALEETEKVDLAQLVTVGTGDR